MRLGPALLALALVACRGRAQPAPDASNPPRARGASTFEAPAAPLVAEGRALVGRFECARCHSIESIAPASPFQDCVGCHRRVKDGTFDARPEHLREWSANLVDLVDSPSLSYVGARLRPSWIAAFLQDPHDVRPNLRATMPRLAVSAAQARAIAAFLTRDAVAEGSAPPAEDPALVTRGRALFAERACGGCHRFDDPARIDRAGAQDASAVTPHALAPDLRFTRQRFRSENLARWILDPQRIKPGTAMPALVPRRGRRARAGRVRASMRRCENPRGSKHRRCCRCSREGCRGKRSRRRCSRGRAGTATRIAISPSATAAQETLAASASPRADSTCPRTTARSRGCSSAPSVARSSPWMTRACRGSSAPCARGSSKRQGSATPTSAECPSVTQR
jgi:mono/diheme cytochrome c family protein